MGLTKKIINNRFNFFIPRSIPPDKRLQWTTYMYSTIHAGSSVIFGLAHMYNYINMRTYMCLFGTTVGYGIHDFMVVWRNKNHFKTSWRETLAHHSTFLYGGTLVLFPQFREVALQLVSRLLLTELSTVFLNVSWFMYNMKYRNNVLFFVNNILLLSTYLSTRVINLTYSNWILFGLRHTYSPYFVYPSLFMLSGLTYLNYKWFYALCKRFRDSIKSQNGLENGMENQIDDKHTFLEKKSLQKTNETNETNEKKEK